MSFLDNLVFPENVTIGTSGGPGHSTRIIAGDGGAETRVARTAGARLRFTVENKSKKVDDTYAILQTVRVAQGSANGFRFKDWVDYTTGPTGREQPSSSLADRRVMLREGGDGTTTTFQLCKPYDRGGVRQWRNITRPMPTGWVTMWGDGSTSAAANYLWVDEGGGSGQVLQTEGTDYTLNASTGVVTFTTAPVNGATIYWSGAFHVPVRFGETADNLVSAQLDDGGLASFDRVDIEEIVDTLEGSELYDPGGASIVPFSANYSLTVAHGVLQILEPSGPGFAATLPDFNDLPRGYQLELLNNSAHTLEIRQHTGAFFFNLDAGNTIRMRAVEPNGWFSA